MNKQKAPHCAEGGEIINNMAHKKRWEVCVSKWDWENVSVARYRGLLGSNDTIHVSAPNWLERRFHISLKRKVHRAIVKQQKQCNIANAKDDESAEVLAWWERGKQQNG
jgi:hypothetical protein